MEEGACLLPYLTAGYPARWLDLGMLGYSRAMRVQDRMVSMRRSGSIPDTLMMLEHPHVYTIGRAAGAARHLLASPGELANRKIEVFHANRGGDITYHGPGQLVGYLVCSLERFDNDVLLFIHRIEELLIVALHSLGLATGRDRVNSGVWIDGKKIAAIGLGLRGGVTFHGFALNVDPDLEMFGRIVPCGLAGREVTSLAALTGRDCPGMNEVKEAIAGALPRLYENNRPFAAGNVKEGVRDRIDACMG